MDHQDEHDDDDTPNVFRMFISNEEMQNHPELMRMIQMLMSKLMLEDDDDDHVCDTPFSVGLSSHVNQEMFRLEVLDEEVTGNHFPQALKMIMNAYKKDQHD